MTQIIYTTRSNQIISDETLDQIESNTDEMGALLQEIADNTAGGGGGGGGDASAANQTTMIGHLDGVETLLTAIDGRVDGLETLVGATNTALASQATATNQTAQATLLGAVTETAPASDTAPSGLNGRLQRIAQRLTTLITGVVLAAGTALIGRVSSSPETSTVYDGTTALVPKFAILDAATSGNNTLVAAVSGKKIRVLQLMLVAAGTVNVRFESGADGTALSGQMQLVAQTGFSLPFSPTGWFETASNTLLNLELSAAISCDGLLVYIEV